MILVRATADPFSLHNYRAYLKAHGFAERIPQSKNIGADGYRLSILGHSVAGLFAGWTKCVASTLIVFPFTRAVPPSLTQSN